MASYSVIAHSVGRFYSRNGWSWLRKAFVDEGISELVDQPDLEGLQREESLVRWQGPIAVSTVCRR